MINSSLNRSHDKSLKNVESSSKEDPVLDSDPSSSLSPAFFSDHIHYLTKSTVIPKWIHNFIFFYLLFQIFSLAYAPKVTEYWTSYPYLKNLFDFLLYFSLVQPAPYNSPYFTPVFIVLIVFIIFEFIISICVRLYFNHFRYLPRIWCYISIYFSLITSTVLLPCSTAYCAKYLNKTFTSNETNVSAAFSFIVLIIQLITFFRAAGFLTLIHCTIPFSEMLFNVNAPSTVTRIYLSTSLGVFIVNSLTIHDINFPAIHIIIFVLMFFNFLYDLISSEWIIEFELKCLTSFLLASSITSVAFTIDSFIDNIVFHEIAVWITIGADFFVFLLVPVFNNLVIKRITKKLNDPNYAHHVRSASIAIRDHYVGFRIGHPAVLNCQHMTTLLQRFPNKTSLYVLCARFNLVLSTVPLSYKDIIYHLSQKSGFSPLRMHLYSSLLRLSTPTQDSEIEHYKKDQKNLLRLFLLLFDDAQNVYNVVIDEIPLILPKILASYDAHYNKTVQSLFYFVQRYPSSPDGKYFVDLFEVLFPKSQFVKELRAWHENKIHYIRNALKFFPKQLPMMLESPNLFRCYQPIYNSKPKELPPIPQPLSEPNTKHRVNSGPYHDLMSRWYVILILAFTFIWLFVTTPLLFRQNDNYHHQMQLLMNGHSLIWQLTRAEAFIFPFYFYDTPDSALWYTSTQYYDFKTQFLEKLQQLQLDLSAFSFSTGGKGYSEDDKKLLTDVMNFMNKNDVQSYFYDGTSNLYQEFLSLTFIALDFICSNQIFLSEVKSNFSLNDAIDLFSLIRKMIDTDINILQEHLLSIDVNANIYFSPTVYLIVSLFFLCLSLFIILYSFTYAHSNFDLFFMTLRDTSKLVLQQMNRYIKSCLSTIPPKYRRPKEDEDEEKSKLQKRGQMHRITTFYLPVIPFFVIMVICVILQYFLYNCFNRQCFRMKELYSDYSLGYSGFSTSITESVLLKFVNDTTESQQEQLRESVTRIFDSFIRRSWEPYSTGSAFCPLCTTREIYVIYIPRGITYEKVIYNFMAEMSLLNSIDNNATYYDQRFLSALQMYYFSVDSTLVGFSNCFLELCAKYYNRTKHAQIALYVISDVVIILATIFLIVLTSQFDRPFYHIVRLISRFPDTSLASDTLKILKEKSWPFKAQSFSFDSAFYNVILEALPDSVIVVDQAHTVLFFNISAKLVINTENAIGQNIFSVLKMDLSSTDENGNDISFNDIVNNFVFGSRDTAINMILFGSKIDNQNQTQKYWFSFSILPIFDEQNRNIHQASNRFALIFRNIGDEKRQASLVADETEKHLSIVHQILPGQVAERLLKDQKSISMTVEKVAISFCDIVSFTPWCGSQTPENVVNTLNFMFNLFDEKISQYPTMTKIKCIGDCYMSSAGIFSKGVPPEEFCTEMVYFGLDMIDSILEVNRTLGTNLRIRVGAALGGPISAGVMGIHKPVFDIWGEAVNEGNKMESTGVPMMVHINGPLYDVFRKDLFHVEPKGDGTYLVTRKDEP